MQKRAFVLCLIVGVLLIGSVSALSFSDFFNGFFGKITGKVIDTTSEGLIAYYNFDNNIQDSSGRGVNGVVGGSPTYVPGKIGNAIDFNGINQYVEFANSNSPKLGNNHTISGWLYLKNNPAGAAIISKWCGLCYSGVYNARSYTVGVNGGKIDYGISTAGGQLNSGFHSFLSNSVLPTNQWVFFAVTYNGARRTTYINGIEDSHVDRAGDIYQSNADVQIGATKDAGYRGFFNGSVDELRFYSRTLSASEIQQLYSSSSIVIQTPVTCNTTRTCVDIDGMNITNKGSVSSSSSTSCSDGTMGGGGGSAAVDSCASSNVVRERYCGIGNYSNYTDIDCGSLGSGFVCSYGRCVQSGVISLVECSNDAECMQPSLGFSCENNQSCLYQGSSSCINPGTELSYCNLTSVKQCTPCFNGCLDGVCIGGNYNCSDSDGGRNIFIKGTTEYGGYDYVDSCVTSNQIVNAGTPQEYNLYAGSVMEYACYGEDGLSRCTDTSCRFLQYSCSNGCSEGACVNNIVVPGSNCTDNELGVSYYTPGIVNYNGQDYKDICYGDLLTEYTCFNNAVFSYPVYNCALENKVCQNGACREKNTSGSAESCVGCNYEGKCIPVGYRFLVKGTPSYCDIYGITPQKVNEENLTQSCQNSYECSSNICSSGQCVELEGFKAGFVKIVCRITNLFSTEGYEKCIAEYVYGACVSSWNCSAWSECTNGEQTRTCNDIKNCSTPNNVPSLQQNCSVPVEVFNCSDSDGGLNYSVKGTVQGFDQHAEKLFERGLNPELSDGLVVYSSTNATLKLNSEQKDVIKGESYLFMNQIYLVSDINYISENNTNNYLSLTLTEANDVCVGNNLAEGICEGNEFSQIDYVCSNGCSNGACVAASGSVCGNNVTDVGEECDGVDLNGKECINFNSVGESPFVGGELGCNGTCSYDKSGCYTQGILDMLDVGFILDYSLGDYEEDNITLEGIYFGVDGNYSGLINYSESNASFGSVITGDVIKDYAISRSIMTGYATSEVCSSKGGQLHRDGKVSFGTGDLVGFGTIGGLFDLEFYVTQELFKRAVAKSQQFQKEMEEEAKQKCIEASPPACWDKDVQIDSPIIEPYLDQETNGATCDARKYTRSAPEPIEAIGVTKEEAKANLPVSIIRNMEKIWKFMQDEKKKLSDDGFCQSKTCTYRGKVIFSPVSYVQTSKGWKAMMSYSVKLWCESKTLNKIDFKMSADISMDGTFSCESSCGNSKIDGGEDCDNSASPVFPGDETCETEVGLQGDLGCTSDCKFDTSNCGKCKTSSEESCLDASIGDSCISEVNGNTGTCEADSELDCNCVTICGNERIDGEEECDGVLLRGKTCADVVGLGYIGVLGCLTECYFDTTGCYYSGCAEGSDAGCNAPGDTCTKDGESGNCVQNTETNKCICNPTIPPSNCDSPSKECSPPGTTKNCESGYIGIMTCSNECTWENNCLPDCSCSGVECGEITCPGGSTLYCGGCDGEKVCLGNECRGGPYGDGTSVASNVGEVVKSTLSSVGNAFVSAGQSVSNVVSGVGNAISGATCNWFGWFC